MSVYFVAGDEHQKHGFIPIACDWAGRARVNFSSPFDAGLNSVWLGPGGPFSVVYVSEADLSGFSVTVVDKDGKPDEFAVGEIMYRAVGWTKEDEETWPPSDVRDVNRWFQRFGESAQLPDAHTAAKTPSMSEENMGMASGGVPDALTRDDFERIKAIRDEWRRQRLAKQMYMQSVDTLIAEVERLHPEWAQRYNVSIEVGNVGGPTAAEAIEQAKLCIDAGSFSFKVTPR